MARPRSEEARQKAIDTTQALLAEGGIDAFTIDAVAKRSGVAKTTLYRHWGSGNELLVHSLDCQVEQIPAPDKGSLEADLIEMFTVMATIMNDPGTRQLILEMMGAAAKDPDLAAVKNAMVAERHRPLEDIVLRAVDRGEIPPVNLEHATLFIEGPFMARVMMGRGLIDIEEIPSIIRMIIRGLGGD
ncbi:MAG: TetR/AcrR family transcriptional regulator [Actinomycetota bacterium]